MSMSGIALSKLALSEDGNGIEWLEKEENKSENHEEKLGEDSDDFIQPFNCMACSEINDSFCQFKIS